MRLTCSLLAIALLVGCGRHASDAPEQTAATDDPAPTRPNFLLIVADDLGYTDLGVFGGEISTPNIDRLAADGLVLTNYYTSPICAPTRAELLSGTDHHRSGQGMMQVNIPAAPGYEGRLNERVISVATRLKSAGYNTMMAGKWHLGAGDGQGPDARGFEQSFVMLDGAASHYSDMRSVPPGRKAPYRENGQAIDHLPDDFYTTDDYTERLISYLRNSAENDRPFFAYLAYTAPHWPVQVPAEDAEKYRGRYDDGYEILRHQRFDAWTKAGWGNADAELPNLPPYYIPWDSLSGDEKAVSSRIMEIHAAMIERMDRRIGDVLNYLESSGQLDNTIVIFQSDNGAEATPGYASFGGDYDNSLENIGKPGSFAYLGPGWAEAGSVPFFHNKSYTAEGGIRVPAIVSGPGLGLPAGREDAVLMAYDIAPTFLELAGADPAEDFGRDNVVPITGRSFAGLLRGDGLANPRTDDIAVGREHAGHGAVRKGKWKLLRVSDEDFYQGVAPPEGGPPPMSGLPMPRERFDRGSPAGTPIGPGGAWQLFDLEKDPGERNDVSDEFPEVFADMLAEWDRYVSEYGVIVKSGQE